MDEEEFKSLLRKHHEGLIPARFICEQLEDGFICYKPECAFLSDARTWEAYKVREDSLVSPRAAFCKSPDSRQLFVKREYSQDGVKSGHYKALCLLHEREYKRIKFEEVIGLMLGTNSDLGYLFHSYSGGVELLGADNSPSNFKDDLKHVVVEGLIELAKNGIDYHDPLPSNLRYNFDGKLVCNPHNCIDVFDRELSFEEQIKNLCCLLYTNSWIEDLGAFLDEYFSYTLSKEEIERTKKKVEQTMRDMDKLGDIIEVPLHWWPR